MQNIREMVKRSVLFEIRPALMQGKNFFKKHLTCNAFCGIFI